MSKPLSPPTRPGGSLGPVADLESHLPAEWWRELFDSVYLKTDGDVVENDTNTVREVDFILQTTGIAPRDRILDLCCGQGRHALELTRRGFQFVTGVDRSRYLIRLARRRAQKLGLAVRFHEADARRYRSRENGFDCVLLLGNSFGYFDAEADDVRVLETVKRCLPYGGTLVLDITDGEWMRQNFERRSWEWIDQNQLVCRERSLSANRDRLVSREVVIHAERGVITDQFYAERLYPAERIARLLDEVGFRDVRLRDTLSADSDRKQDLGMMAHRLLFTASAPRRAIVRAGRGKAPPLSVTVVLGDPHLPDPVKKGGRFNPEDLDTVERLKNALSELDGYAFEYLHSHETLVEDLRGRRTDLVFNLCDEGFNNDPFRELHVPSVLEVLGLPYTGAGPACLALCFDKSLVRSLAASLDIPVPLEAYVQAEDFSATIPSIFPAILKPNFGDSSVGITKDAIVHTPDELVAYFTRLRETLPGRPILVQEFLTGREFSLALVGNPGTGLRKLPILEVDYSGLDPSLPRILGYESKWLPDSPYWRDIRYMKTDLDREARREMVEYATLLFERLGCRDYARFDFRADARGRIKFLEANPNPGWCWDGKFNLVAGFAEMRYAELLRLVLETARERLGIAATAEAVAAVA